MASQSEIVTHLQKELFKARVDALLANKELEYVRAQVNEHRELVQKLTNELEALREKANSTSL